MLRAALRLIQQRSDVASELGLSPVEAEALRRLRECLPHEPDVPDPDWIEEIEAFDIETERAKLILDLARTRGRGSGSSS